MFCNITVHHELSWLLQISLCGGDSTVYVCLILEYLSLVNVALPETIRFIIYQPLILSGRIMLSKNIYAGYTRLLLLMDI